MEDQAELICAKLMLVDAKDSDLQSLQFFTNLVIGHFMCMYNSDIQFNDNILKLGHMGQRSRSHSDIFDIPTLRQRHDLGGFFNILLVNYGRPQSRINKIPPPPPCG